MRRNLIPFSFVSFFVTMLMVLFVSPCGLSQGQPAQSPIRWRMIVKMTSPTEGTVTVKALLSDGWHLYGFDMPKGGPKPTTFDFSESTGIKLVGEPEPSVKPVMKDDKQFGEKLSQWESNVTFVQRFKLTGKGGVVKLGIRYMGCNDATCMPPRTENFSTPEPEFKKTR